VAGVVAARIAGTVSAVLMGIWGLALGALSGVQHGSIVGAILCLSVGVLHGWALAVAHAYDLSSWRGLSAYVIDHTWSGVNTLAGAMFLLVALALGSRLDVDEAAKDVEPGVARPDLLPQVARTVAARVGRVAAPASNRPRPSTVNAPRS
jgi:hypothetical protein